MNVQHSMLCFVVDYITPAVNGHGRGTRLGTCLVQAVYLLCRGLSASVSEKMICFLISFTPVLRGRGTRLYAACSVSPVLSPSAACMTADK